MRYIDAAVTYGEVGGDALRATSTKATQGADARITRGQGYSSADISADARRALVARLRRGTMR